MPQSKKKKKMNRKGIKKLSRVRVRVHGKSQVGLGDERFCQRIQVYIVLYTKAWECYFFLLGLYYYPLSSHQKIQLLLKILTDEPLWFLHLFSLMEVEQGFRMVRLDWLLPSHNLIQVLHLHCAILQRSISFTEKKNTLSFEVEINGGGYR